jgi:putative aminopeptidase FrvX
MNPVEAGDTKCGEGPVLFRGADIQLNLHKQVVDVAKKKKIKFQRGSYNGNSGTDTGAFYKANGGVACQLISLPLKYMHTTVETVHESDVKEVIKLIYHTLQSIEYKQDFRYIK